MQIATAIVRQAMPHAAVRRRSVASTLLTGLLLLCNAAMADLVWVERPDPMHEFVFADADRLGDRVRILYQSMPSLAQGAAGDWTVNVYVAELLPDGRVENRRIATGQRYFSCLLLQRGDDGVFAVATPERKSPLARFEHWSASDGALRASFELPASVGLTGSPCPLFPTDDGKFFSVTHSAQTAAGERPTTLTWTRMSPSGEVLANGQWSNPTAVTSVGGGFPAPGGGLAITLDMRLVKGMDALQTDAEAIQRYRVGDRTLEARVFSETRLLTIDASGAVQWLSPALERDLMWVGDMAIPQDLPIDQMMAQNAEQMALMNSVARKNGAERRIAHQSTVGYDDVQPTASGFGMLARVTADRSLDPPQHGSWFIEVDGDGTVLRETRLEPAAESLEATFERFLPNAHGGLLVAGPRRTGGTGLHVTALGADGGMAWTVSLAAKDIQLHGLAGTAEVPWAFGQGWSDVHGKSLLWAERVDPASADPLPAMAKNSRPQPRPRASSEPPATPTLTMPEPGEGCACTCEEWQALQQATERMKSATQAELMAMVSDPAFQVRMNCTAGCAMQYAACR